MNLGNDILKILDKQYAPNTLVETSYKNLDLAFKTDATGAPILLFLGKKDEQGQIKGERYVRRLKKSEDGKLLKDHWDLKGKAT
ncbi:hypothetical protein JHJ32_00645 [Parapedobacter sp. ISTM3]|uniref:Uncharacterized protein n=1 Tax=Parapedobacter luteus TaxID=623280 RepID=A0A1T5DB94_9SPHI|nr:MULTISPECIES: hypothetical protein [Parapedobacter]MBK1438480.1 hypothetical protein [Parapedobacter sp. ISTM3]SKB68891.1 hypothetical protein SAMN05660226_02665 [Parapedobacter luteus]